MKTHARTILTMVLMTINLVIFISFRFFTQARDNYYFEKAKEYPLTNILLYFVGPFSRSPPSSRFLCSLLSLSLPLSHYFFLTQKRYVICVFENEGDESKCTLINFPYGYTFIHQMCVLLQGLLTFFIFGATRSTYYAWKDPNNFICFGKQCFPKEEEQTLSDVEMTSMKSNNPSIQSITLDTNNNASIQITLDTTLKNVDLDSSLTPLDPPLSSSVNDDTTVDTSLKEIN